MILWGIATSISVMFFICAGLTRENKPCFYYNLLAGHIWTAAAFIILAIGHLK